MNLRLALAVVWLVLGLAPLAWWAHARRKVDVWRMLPVPAALVDEHGQVRDQAGPASDASLVPDGPAPAVGRTARMRAMDGGPLAVTGLRGGALTVALPADPVVDRRDRLLAEMATRLAHDVRTPMSAMLGHLDLILHEPITDAARHSAEICRGEVERFAAFSDDLLALTAIRAGTARHVRRQAGALAEEAVAVMLPLADQLARLSTCKRRVTRFSSTWPTAT